MGRLEVNIKFSKADIRTSDIKSVSDVLKSGWLTHGKNTKNFENEFKSYTNSKFAVTVSSCTAGLHLSCLAIGLKEGDEVIVPAQSHVATAHAVAYTGAKVVFSDVDLISGNMNFKNFKSKVTKKTKAVILVHMAGFPCDLKYFVNFCKKRKIKIIEDCAHALGTYFNKRHVGNFGVSGSFSFYPTKQITTGEGGMVVTNEEKIFKKILMLKAFGIDKDIDKRKKPGDYDVKYLGYNFRMTDFQASLGLNQLKRYKSNLTKRKKNAFFLYDRLKNIKQIYTMPLSKDCSYFVFQIFCKRKRNKLIEHLKLSKIGFSIHYKRPITAMSYYKKKYNINNKKYYKNALLYGDRCISLPVHPFLKRAELIYIANSIKSFFKDN